MYLPSGASLWQEEMEHSLKVSESIFGKQLFGGWDRARLVRKEPLTGMETWEGKTSSLWKCSDRERKTYFMDA